MTEKIKLIIVGAVVLTFALIIVISVINASSKSQNLLEDFNEKFNSSETEVIYIGRPGCFYCTLLEPSLEDIKERYELEYTYINTDNLNSGDFNKILSTIEIPIEDFGTPYIAVVKNGEIIEEVKGFKDYNYLFSTFKDNAVISDTSILDLDYIEIDEYNELLSNSEKSIVVLGASTDELTISSKIILSDIDSKYNLDINYLNLSLVTQEEFDKMTEDINYLDQSITLPLVMILKDNELLSSIEGLQSESAYINFFKEEGIINE